MRHSIVLIRKPTTLAPPMKRMAINNLTFPGVCNRKYIGRTGFPILFLLFCINDFIKPLTCFLFSSNVARQKSFDALPLMDFVFDCLFTLWGFTNISLSLSSRPSSRRWEHLFFNHASPPHPHFFLSQTL